MRKSAREPSDDFLAVLENGVRTVLADPEAKVSEKMQAIQTGAKIAMIRWKIEGADEKGFFD